MFQSRVMDPDLIRRAVNENTAAEGSPSPEAVRIIQALMASPETCDRGIVIVYQCLVGY